MNGLIRITTEERDNLREGQHITVRVMYIIDEVTTVGWATIDCTGNGAITRSPQSEPVSKATDDDLMLVVIDPSEPVHYVRPITLHS